MAENELVYGVVRGVDAPGGPSAAEDERRLLVFAVDTRTHGAGRLLVDLAELERLDDADLPADAAVTPYVYALAGPADRVAEAYGQFAARIEAAYAQLASGVEPSALLAAAEACLVGVEALTPERLADLALLDLLADGDCAYPMPVAVPLVNGWEARGVYATDGPPDGEGPGDAWYSLIEGLLEAWLEVESVPGRDRPWTARDVERVLNDPSYAFGWTLEPRADLLATVGAFTRSLAERPEQWDAGRLEAEYRALFARLEASGRFRRGPDVPPMMSVADWLDAQLARIRRLRGG